MSGSNPNSAEEIIVPPFPAEKIISEAQKDSKQEGQVADQVANDDHQDRGQSRKLRERFSWVISVLVALWMVAIYALLLFQGTHKFFRIPFQLTEKVVLGALGTITLNVIGLLFIILRFVFPAKGDH